MSKADNKVRSVEVEVEVEEYSVFRCGWDFRVGLTRIGAQHQMDGFWTKFMYNEIDLICIGSRVAQLLVHRACIGHGICMAVVMRSSWLRPPPGSHCYLYAPF